MRYKALACDYDGTLATEGQVTEQTLAALLRWRNSDRSLILVTGRPLDELLDAFARVDLFTRVVVDNGALLYRPATSDSTLLGMAPPQEFIDALRQRGVQPLTVGHGIVATHTTQQQAVRQVIDELGLDWRLSFNKGALMILPSAVNKATGLKAALDELELTPYEVVGVGDAENDQTFLNLCGFSVAVANALPMLKSHVDFVTEAAAGEGVIELINRVLDPDMNERSF